MLCGRNGKHPKHKTTSPLSPDRGDILQTAGRQIKLRAGMPPAENARTFRS